MVSMKWNERPLLIVLPIAAALFVSAGLLFLVQPMFAKMVLPLLGSAPSVWISCMVFFQAALLAGYGYAHFTTAWLGARRQAALHCGLLLLPFLFLPIGIPDGWTPPVQENPVVWLLILLSVSVGLPFFMISASAPILQSWFAATGHPSSKDPYFLYAASNAGSMVGLLSYPLLLEPNLRIIHQSQLWTAGYGLLWAVMLGCAVILWRSSTVEASASESNNPSSSVDETPIAADKLWWVALSFVPSSLLLGMTTYLTTDISPIPLLWVIPLALYLLTFILVFSRRSFVPHATIARALAILVLPLVIVMVLELKRPLWFLVFLHLAVFFVAAMVCHGELAKRRPPAKYLTEFYLWMSLGGVVGGLFNALAAPVLFKTVVEYPLAVALACLLRPVSTEAQTKTLSARSNIGIPLGLALLIASSFWTLKAAGMQSLSLRMAIVMGISALVCFTQRESPIRFGLAIGAMFLTTSVLYGSGGGRVLHTERSFFGIHRVMLDPAEKFLLLFHGSTIHGIQTLDPTLRLRPVSYYHEGSPISQVFAALHRKGTRVPIAVVGLGAGTLACLGQSGQAFTFYEIDPAVERIARDPRYFTFLQDCEGKPQVVLGDARLTLKTAPDSQYGLIVIDAFSSDSIPLHLLTREALRLYLDKLAGGGILAFHISNRYLDLRPVLATLASDAGLIYLDRDQIETSSGAQQSGKTGSRWAVMARAPEDLGMLTHDGWRPGRYDTGDRPWTDDFSNILATILWN
jgi:hypothetical protein